ncbi:HD domain-containing protein [Haloactinopolyspora alba]|uniref:HD domain-containing protein n=1 Tax=Haloactinopolyspora alba TaxID=648780 RepID=A0A2P8EG69_9ACTN|nr:HD domain-containing protein [Haloactinopolyspora alba]PSL08450.1 HD domain-containing protein [Haloactinopolyspora alba]
MRTFGDWMSWDDARDALAGRLSAEDVERLDAAYAFATDRHAGQTRPAGEPYTYHLLEVVEILSTALNVTDADLLTAALLHDVVEDTPTTRTEITQRFGPRVAELVDHVTMPPTPPGDDRAAARHRYLSRLRDLPADALRLKLADRYSNVQRLHTHPRPAKQRAYYTETCHYLAPLAVVDSRLADLFTEWQHAYQHLAQPPPSAGSGPADR